MNEVNSKALVVVSEHGMYSKIQNMCLLHNLDIDHYDDVESSVDYALSTEWDMMVIHINDKSNLFIRGLPLIREKMTHAQLFVVTESEHGIGCVDCLHNGADDCVAHPWCDEEFSARLGLAIKRSNQLKKLQNTSTNTTEQPYSYIGDIRLSSIDRKVYVGNELVHLTRTEYSLLEYLHEHINTSCSSIKLLNNILGYQNEEYLPALHSHISRLRRKLSASTAVIVETVWCYGYRLKVQN